MFSPTLKDRLRRQGRVYFSPKSNSVSVATLNLEDNKSPLSPSFASSTPPATVDGSLSCTKTASNSSTPIRKNKLTPERSEGMLQSEPQTGKRKRKARMQSLKTQYSEDGGKGILIDNGSTDEKKQDIVKEETGDELDNKIQTWRQAAQSVATELYQLTPQTVNLTEFLKMLNVDFNLIKYDEDLEEFL